MKIEIRSQQELAILIVALKHAIKQLESQPDAHFNDENAMIKRKKLLERLKSHQIQ